MYQDYFQFKMMPFENTADPRFFFASEEHREALAAIEYTIRSRKGIVMVTGEVGAGKTTLARTMVQRCASQVRIVPVLHGHRAADDLLRQVLRALEVPHNRTRDDHAVLLERLFLHLRSQMDAGMPIALLVDEAHTLSDEALEELRLLTTFDFATQKLLQVILIGQPELRRRVRSPKLLALRQRIAMVKNVRPLNIQETATYISHRLQIASVNPHAVQATFPGTAIEAIQSLSGGTPRLINFACDNCLLLAMVKQTRQITPAIVRQVAADMTPSLDERTDLELESHEAPRLSLAGNM